MFPSPTIIGIGAAVIDSTPPPADDDRGSLTPHISVTRGDPTAFSC